MPARAPLSDGALGWRSLALRSLGCYFDGAGSCDVKRRSIGLAVWTWLSLGSQCDCAVPCSVKRRDIGAELSAWRWAFGLLSYNVLNTLSG